MHKRVTLSLPEEVVARIDAARGDVPRSAFVRKAFEEWWVYFDRESGIAKLLADGVKTPEEVRSELDAVAPTGDVGKISRPKMSPEEYARRLAQR